MWTERQIFVIIEEKYDEVTFKSNIRQISSIKIDALMNSVDMTGDTASVSLENLSLELCKFAQRVPKHSSFEIAPWNEIKVRQTEWTEWPRNVAINFVIFGKFSQGEYTVYSRPQIRIFIKWRP